MEESLTQKGSYDRRELFIITPEPTIFSITINIYTCLAAEPAPGRSVANYPNANMYLQSTTQLVCLETQEDNHPHVRTSTQR